MNYITDIAVKKTFFKKTHRKILLLFGAETKIYFGTVK